MEPTARIPCTVEILTRNSAQTLERLLSGLQDFSEIIVLDGGSTDDTRAIAHRFGCGVVDQPPEALEAGRIIDFAAVRNAGLRLARQPWFLVVDSDEIVPPEFVAEVREKLQEPTHPVDVYEVNRIYVIDGVQIAHSITYPSLQTRLFRRDAVEGFIKPVHERIKPRADARTGRLQHALLVPHTNVFFPAKWFQYLGIESRKYPRFSIGRCMVVSLRRLAQTGLYAVRFMRLALSGKKYRAPFAFEASYLVYNLVHIYWMWKSRLFR